MVKYIKAEFDILHFEKHASTADYKGTTNANPVNDIQTKISLPTYYKYLLKP